MKHPMLMAALFAAAVSLPGAYAEETPPPAGAAMSPDMDRQMSRMQDSMKGMQQQMAVIRSTSDPKERRRLMQEHMQAMQENMKTMRAMGGPVMSGGQHAAMTRVGSREMAAGEMMKRHEMMEGRMDMMQMMLEQMVHREQLTESPPVK